VEPSQHKDPISVVPQKPIIFIAFGLSSVAELLYTSMCISTTNEPDIQRFSFIIIFLYVKTFFFVLNQVAMDTQLRVTRGKLSLVCLIGNLVRGAPLSKSHQSLGFLLSLP